MAQRLIVVQAFQFGRNEITSPQTRVSHKTCIPLTPTKVYHTDHEQSCIESRFLGCLEFLLAHSIYHPGPSPLDITSTPDQHEATDCTPIWTGLIYIGIVVRKPSHHANHHGGADVPPTMDFFKT